MKMLKLKNQILTGLDVGSSKVCAVIAEVTPDSPEPIIKGTVSVLLKELRKRLVVDIENATQSIVNAVSELKNGWFFD